MWVHVLLFSFASSRVRRERSVRPSVRHLEPGLRAPAAPRGAHQGGGGRASLRSLFPINLPRIVERTV